MVNCFCNCCTSNRERERVCRSTDTTFRPAARHHRDDGRRLWPLSALSAPPLRFSSRTLDRSVECRHFVCHFLDFALRLGKWQTKWFFYRTCLFPILGVHQNGGVFVGGVSQARPMTLDDSRRQNGNDICQKKKLVTWPFLPRPRDDSYAREIWKCYRRLGRAGAPPWRGRPFSRARAPKCNCATIANCCTFPMEWRCCFVSAPDTWQTGRRARFCQKKKLKLTDTRKLTSEMDSLTPN